MRRSLSSCLEETRMWRKTERASLEKKPSTRLSQEPCVGVKVNSIGKHAARKLKRAQILLAADAGTSDEEITRSVGVSGSTVYRTKRRTGFHNIRTAQDRSAGSA